MISGKQEKRGSPRVKRKIRLGHSFVSLAQQLPQVAAAPFGDNGSKWRSLKGCLGENHRGRGIFDVEERVVFCAAGSQGQPSQYFRSPTRSGRDQGPGQETRKSQRPKLAPIIDDLFPVEIQAELPCPNFLAG